MTTIESPTETAEIKPNIHDMILDWLAAGIDPEQSIVFVQSHVPEVMSLHTLLSMVTPLGWLLRVPSFKEKARQMRFLQQRGFESEQIQAAMRIVETGST